MTDDPTADPARYPRGGILRKFSTYIVDAREKPAPPPSRDAALKCILDVLSATGAGIAQPGATALRAAAVATRRPGSVPIWFTGKTSSAIGAAWANSAAASELDLDDGVVAARGHPGAAVIPAAFAVAGEEGSTLEELLNAIVIGYEVGATISAAKTAYGSTGTWSAYAVVAAAAALRRTPQPVLEHALAIAGESAPNQSFAGAPAPRTPHPEGGHVKEGITWSVATGLDALALAEHGFRGSRNILDASRLYDFAPDVVPGSTQHILDTYFKPYCCCRHLHAPLDALVQLLREHRIQAKDISGIEVENTSMGLRISNWREPANVTDVQYSHPYCLALVALYGIEALLPLTESVLNDPVATALSHKVRLSASAEFDAINSRTRALPARVTVVCGEQRFVSPVTQARGERLSWAELEDKFQASTRQVATQAQQQAVLDGVRAARGGDFAPLSACLSTLTFNGAA